MPMHSRESERAKESRWLGQRSNCRVGESIQCIGHVVQTLRNAAADIDPLLTVEVGQVPADDSAVLRIAVERWCLSRG